jgi:hypothetical protein
MTRPSFSRVVQRLPQDAMHNRDRAGRQPTTTAPAVVEEIRVQRLDVQRRERGQLHRSEPRHDIPAQDLGVALRRRRPDRVLHSVEPLLEVGGHCEPAGVCYVAGVNSIERVAQCEFGLALGCETALPPLPAPAARRIATDVDDVRPAATALDD